MKLIKTKPRAFELYKKEAQTGNGEAAHLCALYLLDLEPQTDENTQEAGSYLRIAANANIIAAQSLYGVFLYLGTDNKDNFKEAALWFQKAAQNNDPDGMFYWALVNAKGEGVSRNLEIAREYARRAKDMDGEQKASAQRLWQQLEEIHLRASAQAAPKAKTARKRKRR